MRDLLYQLVDRKRTRRALAHAPVDLPVVVGLAGIALALLEGTTITAPVVWTVVGLPLLFLAPGYVTVAALFPRETPARGDTAGGIRQTRGIRGVERVALSFGLSVALLPLFGLVLLGVLGGVTRAVVVWTVVGFVFLGAVLASVRRRRVPPADRYRIRVVDLFGAVRSAVVGGTTVHTAVNLVLVVSVILARASVGYALAAPQDGEAHSTLYVATETNDGDLVAADYPETVTAGEPEPLVAGIDNDEGDAVEYELLVVADRVDTGGGETTVVEREELERTRLAVGDGESVTYDHEIAPTMTGEDLRVSYLLFEDEAPDDPATDDADEHVYFWTDVEA